MTGHSLAIVVQLYCKEIVKMNLSDIKLKFVSFLKNIKPIYIVFLIVLVIIIQAIWAYRTLVASGIKINQTNAVIQPTPKIASNVISLTANKNEFKVGENIPVAINIKSNNTTAGTDLIIKYDPNLLTVIAGSSNVPMIAGTIYDDYPVNKVDGKTGLITFSGITNNVNGIIPKGVFGTIIFQAKAVGTARIFFDFTKGSTNDTNIIENQTAKDVLEEVQNLDLKITP